MPTAFAEINGEVESAEISNDTYKLLRNLSLALFVSSAEIIKDAFKPAIEKGETPSEKHIIQCLEKIIENKHERFKLEKVKPA